MPKAFTELVRPDWTLKVEGLDGCLGVSGALTSPDRRRG